VTRKKACISPHLRSSGCVSCMSGCQRRRRAMLWRECCAATARCRTI